MPPGNLPAEMQPKKLQNADIPVSRCLASFDVLESVAGGVEFVFINHSTHWVLIGLCNCMEVKVFVHFF